MLLSFFPPLATILHRVEVQLGLSNSSCRVFRQRKVVSNSWYFFVVACFSTFLEYFGMFWNILEYSWIFWLFLNIWNILESFWLFLHIWNILKYFGIFLNIFWSPLSYRSFSLSGDWKVFQSCCIQNLFIPN